MNLRGLVVGAKRLHGRLEIWPYFGRAFRVVLNYLHLIEEVSLSDYFHHKVGIIRHIPFLHGFFFIVVPLS